MKFEYRNWGKGIYEVIWLHDYNPVAKMFYTKSLGMVEKQSSRQWAAMNADLKAATRKELSEMMARLIS
jgi:hypothetical protein